MFESHISKQKPKEKELFAFLKLHNIMISLDISKRNKREFSKKSAWFLFNLII